MTNGEPTVNGWRSTVTNALYGPDGFFRADGPGPAAHFRTSAHASPLFTAAVLELVTRLDEALGHPDALDVVDIGAGRGELLTALAAAVPRLAERPPPQRRTMVRRQASPGSADDLGTRIRLTGVEVAARPDGLTRAIGWRDTVPDRVVGLVIATEWLDDVPVDVAEVDARGLVRRVLVDPATGDESPGDVVDAADAFWLSRWWPVRGAPAGTRAEVGWPRDRAWADAVAAVGRGWALAVDYGHLLDERPAPGSLTGYRAGRQVPPVPDGSCDITAHVAMDAVAAAAGVPYTLLRQRAALRALGVDGARPDLALASTDPGGYVRALARASAAAELTDPAGLGGHWWLLHAVGADLPGEFVAATAHTMHA